MIFSFFKESEFVVPPHVLLLADADQGVAHIYANSQTPFKKNKLHSLDTDQKNK